MYLQVSFFHGYVKYDLQAGKVVQVVDLPLSAEAAADAARALPARLRPPRDRAGQDRLEALHRRDDVRLRGDRAGQRRSKRTIINEGTKPYWSTTSRDGSHCFVSWSGTDKISIISYETQKEIFDIKVGDHPQRIRSGELDPAILKQLGG